MPDDEATKPVSLLGKLLDAGFRVAVAEQVEDPAKAKGLDNMGLLLRHALRNAEAVDYLNLSVFNLPERSAVWKAAKARRARWSVAASAEDSTRLPPSGTTTSLRFLER